MASSSVCARIQSATSASISSARCLARNRVDVLGTVRKVGPVDGAVEAGGDARRCARDRDPPVIGGAVGVSWCAGIGAVAGAALDLPELVVGQRGLLDEPGQRFDQADVDELSVGAVDVAVVQRHHHGVGGGLCGDAVGEHERRQRRRPVGLPADMRETAHRLGEGAESGPVARRPAAAVTRHMQHHQLRMPRVQRLVVQPPTRQRARPGVDHQHVTDVEQAVQQIATLVCAQVGGDAFLVAAHALPDQPDVVAPRSPGAQRITRAGLLDLDDVGAELAERGRHQRPRRQRRGVDHPQAGERHVFARRLTGPVRRPSRRMRHRSPGCGSA